MGFQFRHFRHKKRIEKSARLLGVRLQKDRRRQIQVVILRSVC
jgi:hypothetical protein